MVKHTVKDADLFAAAMADVTPLRPKRRRARVTAVAAKKGAAGNGAAPSKIVSPKNRVIPSVSEGPLRQQERSLARLGMTRGAPGTRQAKGHELRTDDGAFDRDVSRALSRRRLSPEASLDLHGMTLAAAEQAVVRFLARAVAQDLRVVLIVTGKGQRVESGRQFAGRIRSEFVGWLNRADNRAHVRAVRAAHSHHGGSGAFYLLLRRRSSASSRSLRATPQR